jgi:hypothetical protein
LIRTKFGARTRDVNDTWRETLSQADSLPSEGRIIGACPIGFPEGECGGELWATDATASEDRWALCRICKTSALVDWWYAQMSPVTQEWLPMRALRWHLLLHVGRRISDATIRGWARDPDLLATRRITRAGLASPSGNGDDVTGRAEYRVQDVLQLTGFYRQSLRRAQADRAIPA